MSFLRAFSAAATRVASCVVPAVYFRPVLSATAAALPVTIRRSVHVGTFKTRSSVKKRFRVKQNGSIVRNMSNRRHLNMAKSRKHVNRLGKINVVSTPGIRKTYLRILQVSPLKGR